MGDEGEQGGSSTAPRMKTTKEGPEFGLGSGVFGTKPIARHGSARTQAGQPRLAVGDKGLAGSTIARRLVSSRNRLSSLNILACTSRSALHYRSKVWNHPLGGHRTKLEACSTFYALDGNIY